MRRDSRQRQRRNRHLWVWAALAALAAVVAAPAHLVGAQGAPSSTSQPPPTQPPPDPALRAALESKVVDLTQQIGALETQLPLQEAALDDATAKVVALDQQLAANQLELERNAAERLLPAQAQRELAVSLYVHGDPQAKTFTDFVRTGQASNDAMRQEVLFNAAEEATRTRVDVLDAEAATLTAARSDLSRQRAEGVTALQAAQAQRDDTLAKRDAAAAALAKAKEELKALLALSQRAPLTGAVDYPIRPVVGVKIDNSPDARPQAGLNLADVVYEEIVEGGVTRFLAMFQSTDAERVGPVRSARTSDIGLLAGYNTPILGFSGGNDGVLAAIAVASIVSMNESNTPRAFYRDQGREAPHNLFTRTSSLYAADSGRAGLPIPQFTFRATGAPLPGGQPTSGVRVTVGTDAVTYTWNGSTWARLTNGNPHRDANGDQVAPQNVIVQFTNYAISPADAQSPDAVTVGQGEAWVFSGGQVVQGRWARATALTPIQYLDAAGNQIPLAPGRTWIALPRPGSGALLG